METVFLHIFEPSYELQAFLRVAELPHVVITSRWPSYGSTGDLPQVAHGSALVGARRALAYLRTVRAPAGDESLHETQAADSAAWMSLVHGTLDDALLRSRLEDGHSATDGAPWSAGRALQRAAAPFDEALVGRAARSRAYLLARGFDDLSWVQREAAAAYDALSERYKNRGHDGPFFFGHTACTLDAVVFGHLASARTSAPCSRWARQHALPSLAPFFAAFATVYFADDAVLGALPMRTLPHAALGAGAAAAAAAARAAAASGAAGVAAALDDDVGNTSLGAVTPAVCRGERGGPSPFRLRELRWLAALQAMAVEEQAAGGSSAAADAAAAGGGAAAYSLASFPLGFGEEPGAIDFARRASALGWFAGGGGATQDAESATSSTLVNAVATLGIFATAAAILLLATKQR